MEGQEGTTTTQGAGFSFSGLGTGNAAPVQEKTQETAQVQDEGHGQAADGSDPGNAENPGLASIMAGGEAEARPEAEPAAGGDKDEGKDEAEPEKIPAWISQLPGDMQKDESLRRFSKIADLVNDWAELSKSSKDGVKLPTEGSTPEEAEEFFQKLGKPKTEDGYSFKGSDDKALTSLAFRANLTQEQAKTVFNTLNEIGTRTVSQARHELQKQMVDTDASLHEEYGSAYGQKMQLLKKGMDTYGGKDIRAKLQKAGLSFDPDIVHMFIQLGELSQEATTGQKGQAASGYRTNREGGRFSFRGL